MVYLASEPSREVSYEAVRNFGHHIPSANRPPIQAATHVRVKVTASKVTDVRGLWSNGVAAPFSACPLVCLCPLPSSASPLLTGVFDLIFEFWVLLHLVWSASRHARDSISMSNALMSLLQTFTNLS